MKFYLFGRKLDIIQSDIKWKIFIFGADGKETKTNDIVIPSTVRVNACNLGMIINLFYLQIFMQNNDVSCVYPLELPPLK